MKMMAMGAAATLALLVSGSPAAVQRVDADAACFVVLGAGSAVIADLPRPLDADTRNKELVFDQAISFYSGSLLARVSEDQLGPIMRLAYADYSATPSDQLQRRLATCANASLTARGKVADAVGTATRPPAPSTPKGIKN